MRKKIGRICALVVVGMFVVMTSMSISANDPDDWTMWGDNTNGWEVLGTTNLDDLRIVTGGVQRMVVTSGGNVGIGTVNPQYTLDVDGIIHASGPLKIGNSIVINGVNDRITATGGTIDFDDENLVTLGNVGIGTINPGSLLHVSAGDEGDAELILESNTDDNNNADNPCITFRQDGNDVNAFIAMVGDFNARVQGSLPDALVIGSEDANVPAVQFAADDEVHMTIWVNGMVGIGTIWPDATLDVAGDVVIDDSLTVDANTLHVDHINNRVGIGIVNPQFTLDVDGDIHATGELTIGNSITIDGTNDKITATGGTIGFDNENLVTTGNVGIGILNPQYTLDVDGDIDVSGYILWPETDGDGHERLHTIASHRETEVEGTILETDRILFESTGTDNEVKVTPKGIYNIEASFSSSLRGEPDVRVINDGSSYTYTLEDGEIGWFCWETRAGTKAHGMYFMHSESGFIMIYCLGEYDQSG